MRTINRVIFLAVSFALATPGQSRPDPADWPMYGGDYHSTRFSPLSEITPESDEMADGLLDPAGAAAEHAAIAGAIAAEDGDQARLLAERHVERTWQRLTVMRLALPPARG